MEGLSHARDSLLFIINLNSTQCNPRTNNEQHQTSNAACAFEF